ncbi:50S ribosomal protein L21 [bacterium]|nr:50S ribosomal protein L21 [bacterium]
MYAVIRTGSKQYRVEPGRELLVEKLAVEEGQPVQISDVLLYSEGEALTVGTPTVPVTVHALCLAHEKGPKLRTIKYRRRKNYKRTMGHRQTYTRLLIEKFEKAN